MYQQHDSLFALHIFKLHIGVIFNFHGATGHQSIKLPLVVIMRVHGASTHRLRYFFLLYFQILVLYDLLHRGVAYIALLFGIVPLAFDLSLISLPLQ